ncbi:hypothetical protein GCM10009834_26060 [Streptomonospora arabica]
MRTDRLAPPRSCDTERSRHADESAGARRSPRCPTPPGPGGRRGHPIAIDGGRDLLGHRLAPARHRARPAPARLTARKDPP